VPGDTLKKDISLDVSALSARVLGDVDLPESWLTPLAEIDADPNTDGVQPLVPAGGSAIVRTIILGQQWKIITKTSDGKFGASYFVRFDTATDTYKIQSETQTFNLAAESFSVEIVGSLKIKKGGSSDPAAEDVVRLFGGFYLSITPTRFELFVKAEVEIAAFALYGSATGLIIIDGDKTAPGLPGLAMRLEVTVSVGATTPHSSNPSPLEGVIEFSGSFSLTMNTTKRDQVFSIPQSFLDLLPPDSPTTVTVYAAAPNIDGSQPEGAPGEIYIAANLEGTLKILNFQLDGQFAFVLSTSKFELIVGAQLSLGALGHVNAAGALRIDSDGLVGRVALELDFDVGRSIGLQVKGDALFEINTTSAVQSLSVFDFKPGGGLELQTINIAPGVLVRIKGSIVFLDKLEATARVELIYRNSELRITGDASISVAGLGTVSFKMDAIINPSGFVLGTTFNVDAGIGNFIKIQGEGRLFINTTSSQQWVLGQAVARNSADIYLAGKLTIVNFLELEFYGRLQMGGTFSRPADVVVESQYREAALGTTEWGVVISAKAQLFNFATVAVTGFLQSDGSWGFALLGRLEIGGDLVGISASINVRAYSLKNYAVIHFDGAVSGEAHILGFGLEVEAALKHDIHTGQITLFAEAEIQIFWWSKHVEHTWELGYLEKLPPPVWLATNKDGVTLTSGSSVASGNGELGLTIENGLQRVYNRYDLSPTYYIWHISTQNDGSETIAVQYGGVRQIFQGVRKIVVHASEDAVVNSNIFVFQGVTAQLDLDGGTGNDVFYIFGGSTTKPNTLSGGQGDDIIQVDASLNGQFHISGGDGLNSLYGGAGKDTITAGPGLNLIVGNGGDDQITTNGGINYVLGDGGQATGKSGYPYFYQSEDGAYHVMIQSITTTAAFGSSGNDTINVQSGTNYVLAGLGDDTIYGGGNNTVLADEGGIWFSEYGIERVSSATSGAGIGGNDTIVGSGGGDLIIAGGGRDVVDASGNQAIVIGDDGEVIYADTNSRLPGDGPDTVVASSLNSPQGSGVENAVDGNPDTYYLNDDLPGGLIVNYSSPAVANGLTLTGYSNLFYFPTPTQVKIWGSDWESTPTPSDYAWTLITDQATGLQVDGLNSTSTISFSNETAYRHYYIQFTQNQSGVPAFAIAEVELIANQPMPVDSVIPTSTNSPLNEGVQYATDGDTSTKYLNKDGPGSGLILTPSSSDAANILTLTTRTNDDIWQWDPSQVKIWGSDWESTPTPSDYAWTLITDQPTQLDDGRGSTNTLHFDNDVAYKHYFIQFTQTKGTFVQDGYPRAYVHISEVLLGVNTHSVASVTSFASSSGDADVLNVQGAKAVIIGGEGEDVIDTPQAETKAIILGDLGQAHFDASGQLTQLEIAAFNSADHYRVDAGMASSTLELMGDVRIWSGIGADGVPVHTEVEFSDHVVLNNNKLVLLFADDFDHESQRIEGEVVQLFSNIGGKFAEATGLFRNGRLTYDLVDAEDPNNTGSHVIELHTVRIPGSGDQAVALFIDSLDAQDEVGMSFTEYFEPRDPFDVGHTRIEIDGLAYLDGQFELREAADVSGIIGRYTWAFVSRDVEGGYVTGDSNRIFVGFNRSSAGTQASVELYQDGNRRVYASGEIALEGISSIQSASGVLEIRQATSGLGSAASTVIGKTISIQLPEFLVGENQLGGDIRMSVGGLLNMSGQTFFYPRPGGGLLAELEGGDAASFITMDLPGFRSGVSGADVAMLVTAQGHVALQSNMLQNLRGQTLLDIRLGESRIIEEGSVSGDTTVYYNDTGERQTFSLRGRVSERNDLDPLSVDVGIQPPDGFPDAPLALVDMRNLSATIFGFVSVSGDYVVKRRGDGDFLMSSAKASLKLVVGTEQFGFGVTDAEFAVLAKATGGIAFHASAEREEGKTAEESGIYIKLPESIGQVTVQRVTVDYNDTGAAVNEVITVVDSNGVPSGLNLVVPWGDKDQPFLQLEVIDLYAVFGPPGNEFFELSGDFAFKKDQGTIIGLARDANVAFRAGDNELSIRNANVGMQINPDGGVAFDGSGTPTIRFQGIADIHADRVRIGWNSTGNAFQRPLTVGEVTVQMDLPIGTRASPFVAVIANGFSAKLGDYLSIAGDFTFQRTGGATGGDITVAATDVDASLVTPAFRMGVTKGNLGLLVKASGGVALSVSGEPFFVLEGGFALDEYMSYKGIGFEYNSTGSAVDQQLVGDFDKTLQLPIGTQEHPFLSAIVTDLHLQVGDYAALSGDFAFQYRSNQDLAIVADKVDASFDVGPAIRGGVTGAKLALLVKSNGTFALQTTGGQSSLSLGSGFAEISAGEMGFSWNDTGADIDEQLDMSAYRVAVSLPLQVRNGVATILVNDLDLKVRDFVDVSGDYALRIQRGPEADDDQVTVLSRDASVRLSLGSEIRIGALDTTLALVINEDETFVIQAAGLPDIHLGSGFDASVSATAVGFSYNNTGRDWDQTVSVNVGDVDVSVAVQVRDDVATAIVTDLEARVADYVSLAGTFAFEKHGFLPGGGARRFGVPGHRHRSPRRCQ
jgi:hypothetical protein